MSDEYIPGEDPYIDAALAPPPNKIGRPPATQEEIDSIVQKLEPYLKAGLSLTKACLQTGVARSVVYGLMEKNDSFRERMEVLRNFFSILVNTAIVTQLRHVMKKQAIPEGAKKPVEELNKNEYEFLKWLATTSNLTKEEFNNRSEVKLVDAEVELRRLLNVIDGQAEDGEIIDESSQE